MQCTKIRAFLLLPHQKNETIMSFSSKSQGKLLLSGEYVVTDGAVALALPTRLGQSLHVESAETPAQLSWQAYEPEQKLWLDLEFSLPTLDIRKAEGSEDAHKEAQRLQAILRKAQQLNPKFLAGKKGYDARTELDFPRNWGLGSSATLISLIADWAKVDARKLLDASFGGSGYDLATAKASGPLLFQLFNGQPRSEAVAFKPSFLSQLYCVHLNQKQSSQEALVHYKVRPPEMRRPVMQRISQITHNIVATAQAQSPVLAEVGSLSKTSISLSFGSSEQGDAFSRFKELLLEHELLLQEIIQQERAKDLYFSDFDGEIKSLGAWGGDFVLAASNLSEEQTLLYFKERGFETVQKFEELLLLD